MRNLEAAQVVYGNVATARSVQGRGGFQTVFRSVSHLTEDEVTLEIEPRLFLDSATGQQNKHVFFTKGDERVVLAHVIPLTGTDESGRGGLYLGHALVFSKDDFRRVDNNPFFILDNFPFFKSVDEAIEAGGNELGDIPPARIHLPQLMTQHEYDGISREQLFQLCRFARQLLMSPERDSSIGFYGSSANVLAVLRDLFLLLPTHLRSRCSFDTSFVGGNYGRTPYFALGLPSAQSRDRRLFCFNVERGELIPAVEPGSPTSYDLWLKWILHPPLSEIAGYVDDADLIAALLDGEQLSGDQRIENADLLLGFKSILETRLADQLKTQLGDLLGDRILPQVVSWARNQGLAGLTPLTRGFSDEQLTRWVADAYEHYHDKPSTTELEELERLTSHNERSFLRLVYLRWSRQWPVLRTTLRALEISASNRFKRWALATVPVQVQSFVRPGQGFFLGLGLHEGNEQAEETYALLSGLVDNSTESPLTCDSTHSDAPPSATSPNPEQMMHSDSIVRLLSLLELLVGNSEELK